MSQLEQGQEAPEQQLQEGQAEGANQETEQAGERKPVNLDELPEFRNWKSKMDRQIAQERGERERLEQQMKEQRSRLQELQLQDAPPDEQVKILKNQLAQREEEMRMQQERQRKIQERTETAQQFLNELGLDWETPGLDKSGDPLGDGFERLVMSAAKIAAQKDGNSKQQVEAKVREAQQKAVKETGAADVSTATEGGGPSLRAQYEKDLAKLRGSRNVRAFVALKKEYREKGLDV